MATKPPVVRVTTDYSKFHKSDENRLLKVEKHSKLKRSFEKYGCLPWWPVVVWENDNGTFDPADGQHRIEFCEEFDLPVYYIIAERNFDIAEINNTQKVWQTIDYAELYASKGKRSYLEALEFWRSYQGTGITLATTFALLAGTSTFHNIEPAFKSGTFVVKDRPWAEAVVALYCPIVALSKGMKNVRFLEACMAVCRVPDFDSGRMIQGARRSRESLIGYNSRDAFLGVMEEAYNYGRHKLFGLKAAALNAMKERDASQVSKNAKAKKELAAAV